MRYYYLMTNQTSLQKCAIRAAVSAGPVILKDYHSSVQITHKEDGSPVTSADHAANDLITSVLRETGIPVISEEGRHLPYDIRKNWEYCWLVDPLDGTREFIEGTDEFTVNIALIKQQEPVFGVIYAPVSDTLWAGMPGQGIFSLTQALYRTRHTHEYPMPFKQPGRKPAEGIQGIAISRFHPDPGTESFIRLLETLPEKSRRVVRGSSLKFCDLAENKCDIYPRLTSIWEWDTAAGHAIIRAAGGELVDIQEGNPLRYNKEELRNPAFLAVSDKGRLSYFLSKLPSEHRIRKNG